MDTNTGLTHQHKATGGFTLQELMITVAVLGILLTVGLPQLNTFLKNSRLTTQTNTLVSVLNFARGEAISRGSNVFLTALDVSDSTNEWGNGWKVWVDGLQTPACRAGGVVNTPNQILEETAGGCNEVLKEFAFNDASVTIDMAGSFSALSAATVTGAANNTNTLMFRGGDGTPALKDATASLDFTLCDNRKNERGRNIRINRVTGRVTLLDNEFPCP